MSTRQKRNTGLGKFAVPVFSLLLIVYFSHHANSGRHGWVAQQEMRDTLMRLEYNLAAHRLEKQRLQKRVNLLRSGSIERDMLDEQARYQLNLLHPDEVAIMLD